MFMFSSKVVLIDAMLDLVFLDFPFQSIHFK